MGIRETQIFGLPKEAKQFLEENVLMVANQKCPECGHVIGYHMKKEIHDSAKSLGMFEDGPDLWKYYLKDGSVVYERVQSSQWSSGPCIFLRLVNEKDVVLFEWGEEDIDNA